MNYSYQIHTENEKPRAQIPLWSLVLLKSGPVAKGEEPHKNLRSLSLEMLYVITYL
jgi:hypothetical protein